jgi:hypothetical protein
MTNWTGRDWFIRRATGPGANVIFKRGATNAFVFFKKPKNGGTIAYGVDHRPGQMTRHWSKCTFLPRGRKAETWPFAKLPKDQSTWTDRDRLNVLKFGKSVSLNSRRLEGDFIIKGKAEAVTLIIAEKAIARKRRLEPLLVVELRAGKRGQGMRQSGNGTGDPR